MHRRTDYYTPEKSYRDEKNRLKKTFAHMREVFYFDICDMIAKNDTKGERLSDYSR